VAGNQSDQIERFLCLFTLGRFFLIAEVANNFGLFFPHLRFILTEMLWATFWAHIFSQTHLVTLLETAFSSLCRVAKRISTEPSQPGVPDFS
jgi:hypothetical protein